MKTLHCCMTVTLTSLRRRKPKKMHQTSESEQAERAVGADSESAHDAHAYVPLADMTEGYFLCISSIDMAGYFVLFL